MDVPSLKFFALVPLTHFSLSPTWAAGGWEVLERAVGVAPGRERSTMMLLTENIHGLVSGTHLHLRVKHTSLMSSVTVSWMIVCPFLLLCLSVLSVCNC